MRLHVIQTKMESWQFWYECKELDDLGSHTNYYMWNPSRCDFECNKARRIDEYLDIIDCLCKKRLFVKLELACEDKMLNTSVTSIDDKIVICKKNNCLIHTISLIITQLIVINIALFTVLFCNYMLADL